MSDEGAVGERVQGLALRWGAEGQRRTEEVPPALPPLSEDRVSLRAARWPQWCPSRFVMARVEDLGESVRARVDEWVREPRGRNVVIGGPVGTGKTHLALAAARERFLLGMDVEFCPVVEVLDRLRPGGDDGAFAELASVDLLVLDDLGAEKVTEWTAERLFALINRRYLDERPTIATTNLRASEMEQLGQRMHSRLVGGAVLLGLDGVDRRRI